MHYHEAAIEQKNKENSDNRYRKLYFGAVDRCAHILSVMNGKNEKELYIRVDIYNDTMKWERIDNFQKWYFLEYNDTMKGEKLDNFRKWYYKVLARIDNLLN